MKEITCNDQLDDLLCNRIDNQSLALYDWTNNKSYVPHSEIRYKICETNKAKINSNSNDKDVSISANSGNMSRLMKATGRLNEKAERDRDKDSNNEKEKEKSHTVKFLEELDDNRPKFDEAEAHKLDEKYMNEITDKFNYNNFEISEKILFINEDAKNLISTILEDTVYNIVSEAVYGETNLTESTKIYFKKFNKK